MIILCCLVEMEFTLSHSYTCSHSFTHTYASVKCYNISVNVVVYLCTHARIVCKEINYYLIVQLLYNSVFVYFYTIYIKIYQKSQI